MGCSFRFLSGRFLGRGGGDAVFPPESGAQGIRVLGDEKNRKQEAQGGSPAPFIFPPKRGERERGALMACGPIKGVTVLRAFTSQRVKT